MPVISAGGSYSTRAKKQTQYAANGFHDSEPASVGSTSAAGASVAPASLGCPALGVPADSFAALCCDVAGDRVLRPGVARSSYCGAGRSGSGRGPVEHATSSVRQPHLMIRRIVLHVASRSPARQRKRPSEMDSWFYRLQPRARVRPWRCCSLAAGNRQDRISARREPAALIRTDGIACRPHDPLGLRRQKSLGRGAFGAFTSTQSEEHEGVNRWTAKHCLEHCSRAPL